MRQGKVAFSLPQEWRLDCLTRQTTFKRVFVSAGVFYFNQSLTEMAQAMQKSLKFNYLGFASED